MRCKRGVAGNAEHRGRRSGRRWRLAAWSTAVALVLLPMVSMQFTNAVAWDLADFVIAAALVLGVGITYELAARKTRNGSYRTAVGIALAAAFILVWANLAVGVIGTEDERANLMYVGVLAIGIVGAVIARFQPRGLARAMVATALAQVLVGVVALRAGWDDVGPITVFFAVLWFTAAWLFRKAAREQGSAGAEH